MNFLFPLFLAGIAAISLPIILHMIRRYARKRVTFSSLMFLHTTLPRFKNRSKLENLPLLILRCIILVLLAIAFSRPFFPAKATETQVAFGKRTVVLIDTSASMRRAGLWQQALNQARSILNQADPMDRVCMINFDSGTQTLIGFEQWSQIEQSRRASSVTELMSSLAPTWNSTNLGQALTGACEAIEDDEINDQQKNIGPGQIILISDLQTGSDLETLQTYEWPENIQLVLKSIQAKGTTNASMQLVANRDYLTSTKDNTNTSIRITNSQDATLENFTLSGIDNGSNEPNKIKDIYVPAGHSIIVRVPNEADGSVSKTLILTGDDHNFDNNLYLTPHLEQQINIVYIGNDKADDSKEMLYYLQRAFRTVQSIQTRIIIFPTDRVFTNADAFRAHMVIASDINERNHLDSLSRYLEAGGTTLLVMKSMDSATTLAALTGVTSVESREISDTGSSEQNTIRTGIDKYALLSKIDFEHPLLMPFSEPRFGDFTKIHFWKHRQVELDNIPNARVLAWFDSNKSQAENEGDPALFELPIGKGTLLVLTSGWQPSDSQLALSSKFVPLLYSILEYGGTISGLQSQYFTSDSVTIPQSLLSQQETVRIRKPDNSLVELPNNQEVFTQTDQPGIYTFISSGGNKSFAVNLPVKESRTNTLQIDDIEGLGVLLEQKTNIPLEQTMIAKQYSSFTEVENSQKIWRWVIVVLLIVTLAEIWLAGRLTRGPESSGGQK